ncbi:unnamed protein product [Orchesella dallaii]|uniref:Uncharacterized protein n=1 Tax=Orchesella dallaii TaxID=48710 RepID=A0ABP1QLM1_9HEXA
MPNLFKAAYETCECNYTCGLSLRKCLRLLTVIGMLSCIIYITVGSYIIVHIIQTEKVELFPNAYYRLPSGPTASRIVVPPPLPGLNPVEDFGIHHQQQLPLPQTPFQQNAIFPVGDEDDDSFTRQGQQENDGNRTIYYKRNGKC